jgi:hypothetical protein
VQNLTSLRRFIEHKSYLKEGSLPIYKHVNIRLFLQDIPAGGAPLTIDQIRMSWFFCSDEGVNTYLKTLGAMEFSIYNCTTGTNFASMKVDLSDLADKVALQQSFRVQVEPAHKDLASVLALEFAFLHINIGCIKFREVEAKTFRLRRRQGLYIPSTPFITKCLPPDGWDPCNEEYIRTLVDGGSFDGDTVSLTMDGCLIPRSRQIQQFIDSEDLPHSAAAADSSNQTGTRASSSKFLPLSDGIAPAPLWQRKNSGALPPRHPEDSRQKARIADRLHSRPGSANSSPMSGTTRSRRRPSSSPIKRTAQDISSRLGSAFASAVSATSPRSKRPESAPPPRARNVFDKQEGRWARTEHLEDSTQRGRAPRSQRPCAPRVGGRSSTPVEYERHSVSAAARPNSALMVRRPASAKVPDRRPSSALAAARQRPLSAFGKIPHSDNYKSRSPTGKILNGSRPLSPNGRSCKGPRPHSAMSYFDIAESIDERDQSEYRQAISPFEFRDLTEQLSEDFMFSRTTSSTSVLAGHFGASRRRPASAMAAASRMEETEEVNARVLSAITRPRSSLSGSKITKCVEGLRNQVPSFQSAVAVSKLTELAGTASRMVSVKATPILAAVESGHKAWREKITDISLLDDDLKALDARSRLVGFRERSVKV